MCCAQSSVVSNSLQSRRLGPARLLCPWEFSRQEYWSELPCLPSWDLPDPGIQPTSLMSPALAGSLPRVLPGKPKISSREVCLMNCELQNLDVQMSFRFLKFSSIISLSKLSASFSLRCLHRLSSLSFLHSFPPWTG